nr:MAG TPA: hypothetical protein [Caudoviricetes sp.]
MIVICEDREYIIKLLGRIIKDLWGEVKLLSNKINTEKEVEMEITRLVFLADEAQQHYYFLSHSDKAVISSNLYYEVAKRYEVDVERFTFAGELARRS